MYDWLYKTGCRAALALVVILVLAQCVAVFDPYELAEDKISSAMQSYPDIETRLNSCALKAQQWQTNPVLKIGAAVAGSIDTIRAYDWWQPLLDAAELGPIGTRLLLETIDRGSHNLLFLEQAFGRVGGASTVASDISRLRNATTQLGQPGMARLHKGCYDVCMGLDYIAETLGSVSQPVRAVSELKLLPDILTGLRELQSSVLWISGGILDVDELCNRIEAFIELPDMIDQMQQEIAADARTMDEVLATVRHWYGLAESAEYVLTTLHIRDLSDSVNENSTEWSGILFVCVVGAAVGAVGRSSTRRARPSDAASRDASPMRGATSEDDAHETTEAVTAGPRRAIQVAPTRHSRFVDVTGVSPEARRASVVCTWDDGRRERLLLPRDGKFTIGSSPADDVRTDPDRSERFQVMIRRARVRYYLEVLDVSKPTKVNGQTATGARSLTKADVVRVGDVRLVFSV